MGAAGRHAKLLERLKELEEKFEVNLRRELHTCASGAWGLFKHNPPKHLERGLRERLDALEALGDDILALRQELAEPPNFPLLTRYREYCAMRGPNTPGEPTLATQFMAEMGTTDDEPGPR